MLLCLSSNSRGTNVPFSKDLSTIVPTVFANPFITLNACAFDTLAMCDIAKQYGV